MRDDLVRAYGALSKALPQAFDLAKERDRREPVVVRHLLLQVPGVHKVAIDKLYAAGLASLDALCRSSVDDLVHVARLERDGADAISTRFRAYWSERASQSVLKAEEQARRRLSGLLEQLAVSHQEFQRAEADEDRERKRTARNARRTSALSINVLLAQLGEVDLVEELERSPTDRKIERIRTYVDRMARQKTQELEEAV
jgi:cell division septum initiation protein DivIVA